MSKSLYIHIPFCRKKCLYCDFYSIDYRHGLAGAYVEFLCRQIKELTYRFNTIYIGGGTPSVLELGQWRMLLVALQDKQARQCEFSVEVNPESLSPGHLELFRRYGVNRISIGLQSLREKKLKALGRSHSPQDALAAITAAKHRGFNNISVDCIFGLWGETYREWKKELKEIAGLSVEHISTYCLTYEKGTPLFERLRDKQIKPLDDATVARMYAYSLDYLPRWGFQHYEVSNFAKKGFHCRHNFVYWSNEPYLALGPSAVSYCDGRREKRVADVVCYITDGSISEVETLSAQARARETAALKIRTREGIDFNWFEQATGFNFLNLHRKAIYKLRRLGLIRCWRENSKPAGIRLTKKGFLYCDEASSAFL